MRAKRRFGSGGKSTAKRKLQRALADARPFEPLENRLYLTAAAYTFQNVAIGAGGFVDGIFYDPNNANTIYARTDIGGLYKTTNDGTSWTQLLDFVGNNSGSSGNGTNSQQIGVLSFAIDPENSNNIYADVGEYTGSDGAVLRSTNGGQTWSTTNLSFYVGGNSNGRGDGEQIAVDPNDSNIIFLGTNANGLWESTNAGQSFSQISTSSFSPTSTTFVLFNPAGTPGSPTQNIFVGIDSTSSGTNLYETTNGGTTWAQVTGTGTLPTDYLPGHGALSGGYLYLGYANAEAPNGSITNGGVYRYQLSSGTWANISPVATSGNFGYDAVAADPSNPNTVVVTSFDYYGGPDQIWRTVNANAATPSWTEVFDFSNNVQDNYGFGGYNTTRNAATDGYAEESGDGISNWAATVAINPFNSNQLMYGTGQGIWATNNISNGGTNTQLNEADSWYFPDAGIEFTAVGGVATASQGVPLFSAIGDIFGFAHTTLTSTPAQGTAAPLSSANGVDAADNVIAIVGNPASGVYGVYSTNDGQTFQNFPTAPGTGDSYPNDTVAVSSNGLTIVWAQSGKAPYYTTNYGTKWTASTGGMAANGQVIADRQNASDFYYYVGTDVYFSSNGGVSFTLETSSAPTRNGSVTGQIAVNPYVSGDLWIAASAGLYHSTNFGATFTKVSSSLTSTNGVIALGAPAPGQTIPAIYVFGTIGGFLGIYRSDDGGSTWLQLNNTSEQWGGLIQTMAADPDVFGRVYIGINGRGIIMGNPTSSLPAGWTDVDIDSPGNPGWATSSTTLSNGTTVTNWIVNGGGQQLAGGSFSISSLTYNRNTSTGVFAVTAVTSTATGLVVGDTVTISGATPTGFNGTFQVSGIVNSTTFTYQDVPVSTATSVSDTAAGITGTTADQLNFAYEPTNSENFTVSAQLLSLTNADDGNGVPEAGVMIRSGTGPTDSFAALMQTASGTLIFEDRSDGALNTQTVSGIPVGSEYVEIVAANQGYTAYYSSNGTAWTQLGLGVTVPTTGSLNVGLAATAAYNPQLTSATFDNVNVSLPTGPTVSQPAAANPNPVTPFTTAPSTALSALGTENGSGSGLTYTWSYSGPTGVTYSGNTNGTNAAQDITANFTQNGNYTFTVTITDPEELSTTSTVQPSVAAAFAVQSGSTLNITLNSSGPVILSGSGGTIAATENGFQTSFTGISSIVVTDSGSGDTLNYSGGITTPISFTGTSASTLNVESGTLNFAGASTISLGTLSISPGAKAVLPSAAGTQIQLLLNSLSITGGILDLDNNEMFITYGSGSDPMSTIYSYLQSGYNGGAENGSGIISTAALTPTNGLYYGLGFSDGKDKIVSGLSTGQIEIRYTLIGDANLDGIVNGSDFSILAANFGQGYTNWDQGNFLFTPAVNGTDFSALSANFGQGISIPAATVAMAPAAPVVTTPPTPVTAPAPSTTGTTTTSTSTSQILDPVKPVLKKTSRHGDKR